MITFSADVQKTHGEGAWFFVMLPEAAANELREETAGLPRRGFGGVKVEVTVAETQWQTSAFPDSKTKSFFLPLKAAVRKAAGIELGDCVAFGLTVVTDSHRISLSRRGAKK